MDANHFRNRAAKAREMACGGDDVRLAEMLLEVALDLEAEADAIDAEQRDAKVMLTHPAETESPWLWRLHGSSGEVTSPLSAPAAERVS